METRKHRGDQVPNLATANIMTNRVSASNTPKYTVCFLLFHAGSCGPSPRQGFQKREFDGSGAVSYTHLTLPTICSV
eukprot:8253197-Karenia_brevis.AAC.1